ncbi:translation elongation factor EF-1 subunit alpha [Candidatus Marsarchaeota G1 archaeon OSP_B]|jgi:translation elongation factor EF-1 alpha|uniref:Elongation factor 1-alpha n=1 Tax=Candidatus Marsarchaeota G1 archaeon OSP_B TaxID=1978153 RepID=A0A2R6ANX4_9ARCH|nr:MAG: translation elongation factor EF-1 subunit alpha [Candidatus Marsarchaeota G1 archaeon OSP_B]
MSAKPHLNLVVIGHIDHGKSTLVGHILYLTGFVDKREFQEIEEEAKRKGQEDNKFAWVLDKLKEERERGITIDLTFWKFETKKYFFTFIDAPGHRDFVKNMVTGASQADATILVVSAKKGEYEAGIGATGQTREHAFLAKTMGVNQLIVAVNKMDDPSVNWSEARYKEVVDGLSKLLRQIGYKVEEIPFVPISSWRGDNLLERSPNTPWYKGPTIIEALDLLKVPPKLNDKPLRIPIQDVYSIQGVGTVPVGRVETGILKVGDVLVFMPLNKTGEVKSIETHHTPIQQAESGDNIGFNVKGISKDDIKRGDVAGRVNNPPTVVDEFTARIFVLSHPTAISVGYTPVLHIHTATVACKMISIEKKLDPKTGQPLPETPQFLKTGDAAIVKFKPIKPLSAEKYSEFPPLGRFAIRDMGRTIAAGVIIDLVPAQVTKK